MNESKILGMFRQTEDGSRFWRLPAPGEQIMDQITVMSEQKVLLHGKDPYKALSDLVNPTVKNLCEDFETKYVRTQGDSP